MPTTPITPELLRGHLELEVTDRGVVPHRLPGWARAQCSDPQLLMAESQPAGVRVAVRTSATRVALETIPTKRVYVGTPPRPDGVYDLLVDGRPTARGEAHGGDTLTIDMTTGRFATTVGASCTVAVDDLPPGEKTVEIWLPHDETTVLVSLTTDAPVSPVPDGTRRRWLHHGSSISHGSNARTPTGTWPVLAATRAGVELTNLGFGGGALLDPFVARTIRDTPADLISLELGINLVNGDVMRLRAFGPAVDGFLDTIREGHPDTPLLVISPILCPIHERTPGPSVPAMDGGRLVFRADGDPAGVAAGKLTLEVIRAELARIVGRRSATDQHLHHLDGRALYGEADAAGLPLVDDLHPDAATHELMGERFARQLTVGPWGHG